MELQLIVIFIVIKMLFQPGVNLGFNGTSEGEKSWLDLYMQQAKFHIPSLWMPDLLKVHVPDIKLGGILLGSP